MTRCGRAIQSVSHPCGAKLPRPSGEDPGVIRPMGKSGLSLLGSARVRREGSFVRGDLGFTDLRRRLPWGCNQLVRAEAWAARHRRHTQVANQPRNGPGSTYPRDGSNRSRSHPAADGKAVVSIPRAALLARVESAPAGPDDRAQRAERGGLSPAMNPARPMDSADRLCVRVHPERQVALSRLLGARATWRFRRFGYGCRPGRPALWRKAQDCGPWRGVGAANQNAPRPERLAWHGPGLAPLRRPCLSWRTL